MSTQHKNVKVKTPNINNSLQINEKALVHMSYIHCPTSQGPHLASI